MGFLFKTIPMINRPVLQSLQSVGTTLHGLRREMERNNATPAASPSKTDNDVRPESASQENDADSPSPR